jgi:hypothetical protein
MTSLRKKEREYSVLRLAAGRAGDETLMDSSRASRAPAGSCESAGARLARESDVDGYAEMKHFANVSAGVSDPTL